MYTIEQSIKRALLNLDLFFKTTNIILLMHYYFLDTFFVLKENMY